MSVVYSLYDALVSINVPNEKAKAVIDAMERELMDKIATKGDVENLRVATKSDFENLRAASKADIENLRLATKADLGHMRELLSKDIQNLSNAITLRMFLTAVGLVPAIVAAQKYF